MAASMKGGAAARMTTEGRQWVNIRRALQNTFRFAAFLQRLDTKIDILPVDG